MSVFYVFAEAGGVRVDVARFPSKGNAQKHIETHGGDIVAAARAQLPKTASLVVLDVEERDEAHDPAWSVEP